MVTLELEDIQGYIIRGYARMSYSRFVLLHVPREHHDAHRWIASIADGITTAAHISKKQDIPPTCLNIALTAVGLKALGLQKENVDSFNLEFREGMVTPHRKRLLGDFDDSDPSKWDWGSTEKQAVHIILMIFGKDKDTCLEYFDKLRSDYISNGLQEVLQLDGQTLPKNKEHFGFRDGISQPVIIGSGRIGPDNNMIKAGEFILGYENEYGVFPDTPLVRKEQGNMNLLSSDAGGSGYKDLGRNGSFLVLRQMEQDVEAFWDFMNEKTKNPDGSVNVDESAKLAAKMMGRWPSGAPITKYPDKDPGVLSDDDDFGYHQNDPDGLKCPHGSHLRRCNPRDSFEDNSAKESLELSNRHRIIRRARLYGQPYVGSPLDRKPEGKVGLLFNCFNADISRQFELIQYTWANSTKVKQLYNDPDPIIGTRQSAHDGLPQNFTIQACPVNKTVTGLKRFVTIKGGGYFFFPSITAIRYLATLK